MHQHAANAQQKTTDPVAWVARAYDSDALRRSLAERGAWANIKPMPNRKTIPPFSTFLYRYRNLVERFFKKLKHFRAVATRYDKNPDTFLAGVKLASTRIWMRFIESMTWCHDEALATFLDGFGDEIRGGADARNVMQSFVDRQPV